LEGFEKSMWYWSKWFDKNITWNIGNVTKIKFWEDRWTDEISLAEKFPGLYSNN